MHDERLNLVPLLQQVSKIDLNAGSTEDLLIIGLDFGTTFSGIAWAITPTFSVQNITDWPGLEGQTVPKVPTRISYDPEDNTSFKWGAQKTEWPVIEAVKLLLDPDQELPYNWPRSTQCEHALDFVNKSAVNVAADYIGAIYHHALSHIKFKVESEFLSQCRKQFVITVPAVWSDKAKDATVRAAKQAGIHPVTVVKEPEAAALYTLDVTERALKPGDAFIVCDAGGGTVDLISYEIQALHPQFVVGELVPSSGALAGSIFLDRRFEEVIKQLVGRDQFVAQQNAFGLKFAMQNFEKELKRAFTGDEDDVFIVNFPMASLEDDNENRLKSNTWVMKGYDVKEIFDPIVTQIIALVRQQVDTVREKRLARHHLKNTAIKAIFLVGGFGSSHYLRNRIKAAFEDIQVIQPVEAWSAIVKGAVLCQIPNWITVETFVAQKHYGVSANATWDEERDKGQRKMWNSYRGNWQAETMTWYVHRDQDLTHEQKIVFPFSRALKADHDAEDLIFEDDLIESYNIRPPVHPEMGKTKVNVTLTSDLRNIDKKHIKRKVGADGKFYHVIRYSLTMKLNPALFKFALEIEGEEFGTVDAEYT